MLTTKRARCLYWVISLTGIEFSGRPTSEAHKIMSSIPGLSESLAGSVGAVETHSILRTGCISTFKFSRPGLPVAPEIFFLLQFNALLLHVNVRSRLPLGHSMTMFPMTFKSASNAKTILVALALVLGSLSLLLPSLGPRSFVPDSLHIPSVHKTTHGSSTIPNIVHFVHLSYPNSTAPFEFPFRQFVAVYSAWYYLKPEIIYIWTNVEEGSIEGWIKKAKSPYTQAVSDLPGVEFKHHDTTTQTTIGTAVELLPNHSDFVRTDILM